MKILILGSDGYIGYPLTIHLLKHGHEVYGIDNGSRRRRVGGVGSASLTPILSFNSRKDHLNRTYAGFQGFTGSMHLGLDSPSYIRSALAELQPDAIVHLAEQPSAPWSMINPYYASETQVDNVIGTLHLLWAMKEECPNAHLIKLGSMGEYGTPDCDIPEGTVPSICTGDGLTDCPMSGLMFPRTPGSFYHLSKVHDTHNIHFACRNWGLRSTDIMQGVVFGLMGTGDELTRFDYDEYFGTVINRFCAQAISEHDLTIYGLGEQVRGFLALKDSIQCLTIAIENPPEPGSYRTFNQFENIYSLNSLATLVIRAAANHGIDSKAIHLPNPRKEAERHYYNPYHENLANLGYVPTTDIYAEICELISMLLPYRDMVIPGVITPTTQWV